MNATRRAFGPVVVDILPGSDTLQRIHEFIRERVPRQIVTLNALMFNQALRDARYAAVLGGAALAFPDSVGIVWGISFITGIITERLPGIDLINLLCEESERCGYRIFLLGAAPGVADECGRKLRERFPSLIIAGTADGYFSTGNEQAVIAAVAAAKPHILLVGLSLPRQEMWIAEHLQELKTPVVMGVGGSFDVLSGRLRRAPRWIQRAGFEWLYRTLQQPWRVARIKDLPLFVYNVFRLKYTHENNGQSL